VTWTDLTAPRKTSHCYNNCFCCKSQLETILRGRKRKKHRVPLSVYLCLGSFGCCFLREGWLGAYKIGGVIHASFSVKTVSKLLSCSGIWISLFWREKGWVGSLGLVGERGSTYFFSHTTLGSFIASVILQPTYTHRID